MTSCNLGLKVWSHDAVFHQIFNWLPQVNGLKSIVEVVTWYNVTLDFQLIKPTGIQYYYCMGNHHCDVTILTKKSIKNQMHFRFSIDFILCFFDLWLRWLHGTILVESESDDKIVWKIASCDPTISHWSILTLICSVPLKVRVGHRGPDIEGRLDTFLCLVHVLNHLELELFQVWLNILLLLRDILIPRNSVTTGNTLYLKERCSLFTHPIFSFGCLNLTEWGQTHFLDHHIVNFILLTTLLETNKNIQNEQYLVFQKKEFLLNVFL